MAVTLPAEGDPDWADPLNDAIEGIDADLQTRAEDSEVVHTTGDEGIAGTKTFAVAPIVPDASFEISAIAGLEAALGEAADGGAVLSVNDLTGAVTLDAAAVGALPADATFDDIADGLTNIAFTTAHEAALAAAAGTTDVAEIARDAVGSALVEGAGIDITVNDGGNSITIAATGGGGGGGYTRDTEVYTTASLAADASEAGNIALGQAYTVYRVEVDKPARVRLYATDDQRDADELRPFGEIPTGNHGIVLDVLIDAPGYYDITPTVSGANLDVGNVPIMVTNADSTTGTVQVDITYLRTE